MNNETIYILGECAFWTNAQNGLFRGRTSPSITTKRQYISVLTKS